MPKDYTTLRDKLIKTGKDPKAAKAEAAAIYNKRHPSAPLMRKRK